MAEGGWFERPGATTFNLYRPPVVRQGNSGQRRTAGSSWCSASTRRRRPHRRVLRAPHPVPGHQDQPRDPARRLTGIGKDTLLEPLKLGVGPWNFKEVFAAGHHGNYNDYMQCVVLRISEAHDLGDINRYAFHDHMKTILAAPPDVIAGQRQVHPAALRGERGRRVPHHQQPLRRRLYLPPNDRRTYVAVVGAVEGRLRRGFWTASGTGTKRRAGGRGRVPRASTTSRSSTRKPRRKRPMRSGRSWRRGRAGESELADILDTLRHRTPTATLRPPSDDARQGAGRGRRSGNLSEWLNDRKNRRVIPHRLEACGYTPVLNNAEQTGCGSSTAGGRWSTAVRTSRRPSGSRRPRKLKAAEDRLKAAEDLKKAERKKQFETGIAELPELMMCVTRKCGGDVGQRAPILRPHGEPRAAAGRGEGAVTVVRQVRHHHARGGPWWAGRRRYHRRRGGLVPLMQ